MARETPGELAGLQAAETSRLGFLRSQRLPSFFRTFSERFRPLFSESVLAFSQLKPPASSLLVAADFA
eukprot:396484-Prorocentrum_minimum.AAC.1